MTGADAPRSPLADARRVLSHLPQTTFVLALLGGVLLWLAQPPAMLGLLGWLAPAPWLMLVARREGFGRRHYLKIWLAGGMYWLAAVYWICLPHPLTPIGLPFLAAYLGLYLPLFVGLSRVGVGRLRMPLWLAAPVVWTGLEWFQTHLFTGFLMGGLSHTQAWYPGVIQIAAWLGAYGVSFVMVMFAAGVVDGVLELRRRRQLLPVDRRPPIGFFAAAFPVVITLFVGHYASRGPDERGSSGPSPTIALIQGDTRATWDPDPDRSRRIMDRHSRLSRLAVAQADEAGRRIDLMVWPESMFRTPLITFGGGLDPPEVDDPRVAAGASAAPSDFAALTGSTRVPLLTGIDHYEYPPPYEGGVEAWELQAHNAAAFVDASGRLQAVYDKMHRVPFGEYIPLFENWQALYFLTPLPGGIRPGEGPVAMTLGATPADSAQPSTASLRLTISPNICYESVIPHVIRKQVKDLQDAGTPPDLLVNVTNNAWFWGSSELEMHLACNIFRAVENRTPMVVAANGGLSAAIDGRGRVIEVSDRMTEQVILADVPLDPRVSFYTRHGDVLAVACLIVCGMLAIIGSLRRRNAD